ncbi:MAG TPA: ROK family protein [Aliiroseovarius sp.]|nr:ROK family protein [Aliiroseovarius sp.]
MKHRPDQFDLLADIGGTNTRVALAQAGVLLPGSVRRYENRAFTSLDGVLTQFVRDEGGVDCRGAAIALAGPVQDGVGVMTNLDWRMDHASLRRTTRAETSVILNDLQAQGYALERLTTDSLTKLIPGKPGHSAATRLVIGLGTGFNATPVYTLGNTLFAAPSEVGHSDLPVRTAQELDLAAAIASHPPVAAIEDLLSGKGLARAYGVLTGSPDPVLPADVLARANDGEAAAKDAVQAFVTLLARVASDLALTHLPYGGIFLSGGVARAIAPFLIPFGFQDAFENKGRFAPMMKAFSLSLITDDFAALEGCAEALALQRQHAKRG